MADGFLESYQGIVAWLRSRILTEQDSECLLNLAFLYGEIRSNNFDGVYHDDEVEQHVADHVLKHLRVTRRLFPDANRSTVLIASELYDAGGHSLIVGSWLESFLHERDHSLLVTRTISKGFDSFLRNNGYAFHLCRSRGLRLVSEIIEYCQYATRVVLHINPDDIFSAIAAKCLAQSGKTIIFFNHADHVFSYGISSASLIAEVSSYGIALNRRTQRSAKSCYIGIPIRICQSHDSAKFTGHLTKPPIVLTCGAAYKYRPAATFFGDLIDKLAIQARDVTFALVGPSGKESWWANHAQRWGNRVHFLGVLHHDQYLEVLGRSTVYVDSFPFAGGTAFPEALLCGKLVAGLQNAMQGYSPVDGLRVATLDDLVSRIADLLAEDPVALKEIEDTRIRAAEAHSLETFRNRILAIYKGNCEPCPWEHCVTVDTFEVERAWKANKILYPPLEKALFCLPIPFCIRFLLKRSIFHRSPRYGYLGFAISRLILRLLPAWLRDLLIAYRTDSIARGSGRA